MARGAGNGSRTAGPISRVKYGLEFPVGGGGTTPMVTGVTRGSSQHDRHHGGPWRVGRSRRCRTKRRAPVLRIRRARQLTVPAWCVRPLPSAARLLRRASGAPSDPAVLGQRTRGVADGSHRRPHRQAGRHRDRPAGRSRMPARPGDVRQLLGVPGPVHRPGRGHGMRVRFGHRPAVRPARASRRNGRLRQDQVPVHHARDGHFGSRHRRRRPTPRDFLGSCLRQFGGVPRAGRGGADVTGARDPRRGRGGRAGRSRGARRHHSNGGRCFGSPHRRS